MQKINNRLVIHLEEGSLWGNSTIGLLLESEPGVEYPNLDSKKTTGKLL
jgi:hypothetical protein